MSDGQSLGRRRSAWGTVGYYEEKIEEAQEDLRHLDFDQKRLDDRRAKFQKDIMELTVLLEEEKAKKA